MRAYEFTTNIRQGQINIPLAHLKDLNAQNNVRVIILAEEDDKIDSNKAKTYKLSEDLLIFEIDNNDNLFTRDNDIGREINL